MNFDLNVNFSKLQIEIMVPAMTSIESLARQILAQSIRLEGKVMSEFDDLTREVSEIKVVATSAKTLIEGLSERIRNAPDMAAVKALADELDATSNDLAAAVAANTPAAPAQPGDDTANPSA